MGMLGLLKMMSYGILHGVGLRSKVKIVVCSFICIIPWVLKKPVRWIEIYVKLLTPDFSDVMIEFEGNKYMLVDFESLFIVVFYETWMEKYLEVSNGDVFIDIGAHIGKYSLLFSKVARRVIAVESDPDNYYCLKRNIEINETKNITALNALAWDKSTIVKFYITDVKSGGTTKKGLPHRQYLGRCIQST